MEKPKIYFVPVYIASMKYYAKLFPYLSDIYDTRFLIVRRNDHRREQMEKYCKENNYHYDLIDGGLNKSTIRIPFLTTIYKKYLHAKKCRTFLKAKQPAKIILTKAIYPHDIILREANRLGIKTAMLQWALAFKGDLPSDINTTNLILKIYFNILDLFYKTYNKLVDIFSGNLKVPKKIGAIDKKTAELFAKRFNLSASDIDAVGMIDYQIVSELKKQIDINISTKKVLHKKYNISNDKLNILIPARAAHLNSSVGIKLKEQIEYYHDMLKMVRSVFPSNEANILFKLHPSDNPALYEQYREFNIKIYSDEATTEELICLSDLIISDPWTSVNYMIVASDNHAVFANFSSLQSFNKLMENYGIKRAITDKKEFLTKLQEFKKDTLEKQYDNSHIDVKSIDKIVDFIKQ